MAHFRQFSSSACDFSYLLVDMDRREAVLIDPDEGQAQLYMAVLEELQARLGAVLLTHVHAADTSPARLMGVPLVVGRWTGFEGAQRYLDDGDVVPFGDELVRAWHTPGHTKGCVTYAWRDRVFTGHGLLIGDCGSTDDEGADAGVLYDSLTRRLLSLPDETLVYPGRGEAGRRVSCIGEERQGNRKLSGTTRDEFIALQQASPVHTMMDFVAVGTC